MSRNNIWFTSLVQPNSSDRRRSLNGFFLFFFLSVQTNLLTAESRHFDWFVVLRLLGLAKRNWRASTFSFRQKIRRKNNRVKRDLNLSKTREPLHNPLEDRSWMAANMFAAHTRIHTHTNARASTRTRLWNWKISSIRYLLARANRRTVALSTNDTHASDD